MQHERNQWKNSYKISIVKYDGTRPLGIPSCRFGDDIKIGLIVF